MPAPFRRFAKRAAIADRANDVFSPSVRATREHIWFLLVLLANIVIWDLEFRKAEVFSASVQILFYILNLFFRYKSLDRCKELKIQDTYL